MLCPAPDPCDSAHDIALDSQSGHLCETRPGRGVPLVTDSSPWLIGRRRSQVAKIVPAGSMSKIVDLRPRLQELVFGLVEDERSQGVVRVSLLSGSAHMMRKGPSRYGSFAVSAGKPYSQAG